MNNLVLRHRRVMIVGLHLALIVVASYLAFSLQFDGSIPTNYLQLWWQTLPWLVAVQATTLLPFRLYEGLWRYASIWDLRNIVLGVVTSSGLFYFLVAWRSSSVAYPRSIVVIDALLLILGMGGVRLGRRIYRELSHIDRSRRVLIFGAGDAGEMIVRDMRNNSHHDYEPIGFVDDDLRKVGARIHGVLARFIHEGADSSHCAERTVERLCKHRLTILVPVHVALIVAANQARILAAVRRPSARGTAGL